MDEIRQPATIANGGIMFLSISDKDEKEDEKHPGYIYYYRVNNCTLTGNLTSTVSLTHYESSRTIVSSSYRSDGGDAYVSDGKYYDDAHDVSIHNGGYLRVNGQTVSNIAISSGGSLSAGGGTLQNIEVLSGGKLTTTSYGYAQASDIYVHKDATVVGLFYNVTLEAKGGGIGSFANLGDKDQTFHFISNTYQNSALVQSQTITDLKCTGSMYVNAGGTVSGGEAASGARWTIGDEGIVDGVRIANGGNMSVTNGGVARNLEVMDGGVLSVNSYGYAKEVSDIYVHKGARLDGRLNNVTLEANGGSVGSFVNLSDKDQMFSFLIVSNGGNYANVENQTLTDLKCTGKLNINAGGVISGGELSSGGTWYLNGDGTIHGVTILDGGYLQVNNCPGVVDSVTVSSGGSIYVSSGNVRNVEIFTGGRLTVNYGNPVYGLTVRSGGSCSLYLTSAYDVYADSGAILTGGNFYAVTMATNASAMGFINLSNEEKLFYGVGAISYYRSAGIVANQTITDLKCQGQLYVYNNGIVSGGEVCSGANWQIAAGGLANGVSVTSGGELFLSSGTATNVEIYEGGRLSQSNGYVSGIYVHENAGTSLYGTFYNVTLAANGGNLRDFINLSEKDQTFYSLANASYFGSAAIVANQTITDLKCQGQLYIHNSGIVSGGEICSGARWVVAPGGIVDHVSITSGGDIYISSGSAINVEVYEGGRLSQSNGYVSSIYFHKNAGSNIGGVFYDVTLAANGGNVGYFTNIGDKDQTIAYIVNGTYNSAIVSSQTVTDLKCLGQLYINNEGIVSGGEVCSGARWNVYRGGTVDGASITSGGNIYLSSGTATNVDICSGGVLTCENASVTNIYVHESGGSSLWGEFYNATLAASGGNIGYFTNLSDKDQTFAFITKRSYNSAIISSQTLTDLKCLGNLYINNAGIVSGGEAASGGYWTVNGGGLLESITVASGGSVTINNGGLIQKSFNVEGALMIYSGGVARIWSASTVTGESASLVNSGTIEFLVASAAVGGEALLNDYTKVSGYGGYDITVNGDQSSGQYRLIGNAAGFNKNITIKAENSDFSGTFKWNGTGYNTVVLGNQAYALKIDENNDLVLSVAPPLNIINFDQLKTSVSTDWEQYRVQVKLDKFNDDFKKGWGKKTNHRSYFSLAVSDLAVTAVGSADHINLTCNGRVTGLIGILKLGIDLGQAEDIVSGEENTNTANAENRAGLYLSLNKDENGEWDWGNWDFVGTISVTLQQVDHRFKFHLFDTTFDPMKITGTADINTKTGIYTITVDWKKSGYKEFQHMSASATLKDCSTESASNKGLELSSFTIKVYDDPDRERIDTGFHIYRIEGTCYNLASFEEDAAGFKGEIGFTWYSFTVRADYEWQRTLLNAAGIQYQNNMVKVSAVDTELSIDLNLKGDFTAKGCVRVGNIGDKSLARINGEVTYYASNQSLTVIGSIDIAGLGISLTGFVWSYNHTLTVSAQGSFTAPGWMKFLTGSLMLSSNFELISTDYSTCIAVWGEVSKGNKSSHLGYLYNLTTGDVKKISTENDVTAAYNTLATELQMGMPGSVLYNVRMEQYERVEALLFKGVYCNASQCIQVRITNERTGETKECRLGDYIEQSGEVFSSKFAVLHDADGDGAGIRWLEESVADASQDDTAVSRGGSESEMDSLQMIVESFDASGFSIRITGKQELLWGDWRVDILDTEADLNDLEVNLLCEESPVCQLEDYSVTGFGVNSISIDYSISGGGEEVNVFVYRINHDDDEETPRAICVGVLEAGEEQHATIDTTLFDNGFYEFYLHVTGEFIPIDSEVRAVFSIAERNASDGAMVEDAGMLSASECLIVVSTSQESGTYALVGSAEGYNKAFTIMTDAGGTIGTISVGETVSAAGARYTLTLDDSVLSLTVSAFPRSIVGDFNGDGKAMLVTESDGVHTIYADGAAWGGLTLDPGWYVAGVGDFNGDGSDDFLRVNDEGYVVGEMSNGEGAFAPQVLNFLNDGWGILGIGDFNGNGTDDVLIANPTAASETVGLLGYWESGVTWTLINGYSAEWECVATGDFNGDGKCDMLWRNWFEGDGGLTYNAYCTWIVDDPVDWRMVSVANPMEWNFLCSGDFDGDKMNDIAMINDVGVVGIWGVNDGWLSSWSILSAVTSEWQLAGVGDFNADGTDDIAWCSATTGQVGCWQIENKELASWQTIANLG